ncbi:MULTISPECIES: hypothetical protein [Streptomyces]|uniref:hypothetical protein n=1 Tax=Streptomyces TaxID=1883 RepID=UPI002F411978
MTDRHENDGHADGDPDNSGAFPPLGDDEWLGRTASQGLTIGELVGLTGAADALNAAIGPTMANFLENLMPSLMPVSVGSQIAESLQDAMPRIDMSGLISPAATSQLNAAFADAALAGLQINQLYRRLDVIPGLADCLRALDEVPGEAVDAPADALNTLQEPARQFAAAEGRGRSWEEQRNIFAGAMAAVVLLLLLQAMITSDVFKEMSENANTVSGAVAITYLVSKKAWAKANPKQSDEDDARGRQE